MQMPNTIIVYYIIIISVFFELQEKNSPFYCLMIHISDNINDCLLQVLLNTHQS